MYRFSFCTHPYFIQNLFKRLYSYTYVNCFQKYNFTLNKNLDFDIKLPSFIIIIIIISSWIYTTLGEGPALAVSRLDRVVLK